MVGSGVASSLVLNLGLIERFNLPGYGPDLLAMAQAEPEKPAPPKAEKSVPQ